MIQLTINAPDQGTLLTVLLSAGLFTDGETGQSPANGVVYSYIGDAAIAGTNVLQAGKFGFIAYPEEDYPDAEEALADHVYAGETLRQLAGVDPTPKLKVSPRQFRQALVALNLYSIVNNAVATSNDDNLKIWWEFASTFERDHPLIIQFGEQLGKTTTEMDNLFALAVSL
jgi:hypothetical protein